MTTTDLTLFDLPPTIGAVKILVTLLGIWAGVNRVEEDRIRQHRAMVKALEDGIRKSEQIK